MGKLVRLTQCNTRVEAEMLQALLNSAGIKSFVTADDVGGLFGFKYSLSTAGSAQVMVSEAEYESASEIIKGGSPESSSRQNPG